MSRRLYVEEYRIWKRSSPYLYDFVVSKALEWPSLTCEWLPDRRKPTGTDYSVQSLLLGTHTTGNEQNYLMIADVRIPDANENEDDHLWFSHSQTDGAAPPEPAQACHKTPSGRPPQVTRGQAKARFQEIEKVDIVQKINHEGEVNRARSMPQNYYLVATKSPTGQVLVFDTSRHALKPPVTNTCNPQLRLGGHKKEGYGLSWNPRTEGRLLSGSDDGLICTWDVLAKKVGDVVDPTGVFHAHQGPVQDVSWHNHQAHLFGSVGDDKQFMLWDVRSPDRSKPAHAVQAHKREVTCLSFNPELDSIVVTGSSDKTIALWDIRYLERSLHVLEGHSGDVFQVSWSPRSECILASASADRRVFVWNLSKIPRGKPKLAAGEYPPELVFVHGGHTGKLNDISWNYDENWFLASVAEDNIVQVWCPGTHVTDSPESRAEPMVTTGTTMTGVTTSASSPPAAPTTKGTTGSGPATMGGEGGGRGGRGEPGSASVATSTNLAATTVATTTSTAPPSATRHVNEPVPMEISPGGAVPRQSASKGAEGAPAPPAVSHHATQSSASANAEDSRLRDHLPRQREGRP